jgi:hypothetical protein
MGALHPQTRVAAAHGRGKRVVCLRHHISVRRGVFASQGQEAFIEGHLRAFAVLSGVPFDKLR